MDIIVPLILVETVAGVHVFVENVVARYGVPVKLLMVKGAISNRSS